ncbi:MAG: serine hydrolase domain-containing protein [Vitreoscilla sp.]
MKRRLCVAALVASPAFALPEPVQTAESWPPDLTAWDHDAHADLRAVVVMQGGRVVAERYYNGEQPTTLHDIRSAGKSITSLLVGAAMDRGRISGVADPVLRYWPQARAGAFGDVAIEDILTMRSGLAANDEEPDSPGNEDKLDAAPDPVTFMLGVPREAAPGSVYRYNSLTAHIAGRVVENATRNDLEEFAAEVLFRPLDIRHWAWGRDVSGHPKGQGNLSLTARDLASIGEMVRCGGSFHGRRIVSAAWMEQSLRPHVMIAAVDRYADGYGYYWYSKTQHVGGRDVPVFFASGNGGNKVYVVPGLDLVLVVTSSAYGQGYGQRRSEDILKAVLAAATARGAR